MEKRYTIDPADFTEGQWEELYNVSTIMPRTYESKHNARPLKRTKHQIELAIQRCANEIDHIRHGGKGPETRKGANAAWIQDLRDVSELLTASINGASDPVAAVTAGNPKEGL